MCSPAPSRPRRFVITFIIHLIVLIWLVVLFVRSMQVLKVRTGTGGSVFAARHPSSSLPVCAQIKTERRPRLLIFAVLGGVVIIAHEITRFTDSWSGNSMSFLVNSWLTNSMVGTGVTGTGPRGAVDEHPPLPFSRFRPSQVWVLSW